MPSTTLRQRVENRPGRVNLGRASGALSFSSRRVLRLAGRLIPRFRDSDFDVEDVAGRLMVWIIFLVGVNFVVEGVGAGLRHEVGGIAMVSG